MGDLRPPRTLPFQVAGQDGPGDVHVLAQLEVEHSHARKVGAVLKGEAKADARMDGPGREKSPGNIHETMDSHSTNVARLPGLEPGTYGLEGRCSVRLSYRRAANVRYGHRLYPGGRARVKRRPAAMEIRQSARPTSRKWRHQPAVRQARPRPRPNACGHFPLIAQARWDIRLPFG